MTRTETGRGSSSPSRFLAWKRTRPFAYLAVLVFHGATWALFPIGMFPFIMSAAAMVFFDASWPRRLLQKVRKGFEDWVDRGHDSGEQGPRLAVPALPSLPARVVAVSAVMLYAVAQLVLPLRAHLYGGNVSWHEQGMRFSWRVMTREKNGSVTFVVKNPRTGRTWEVPPSDYLTRLQEREMSVQPDLIWQLAQRIAKDYSVRAGGPVQVHAEAYASLNGRPTAPLIDPNVDLAQERDSLLKKAWILPQPDAPPAKLQRVAGRRG